MSIFLGLNIGPHDSSAAFLKLENEKIVDASIYLSERIVRKKHAGLFPLAALKCFKNEDLVAWENINDDHCAVNSFNNSPQKLEQLILQTNPSYADLIELNQLQKASTLYNKRIQFITHHQAHAYSALAFCPFSSGILLVSDGIGNRRDSFPADHPEFSFAAGPGEEVECLSAYLFTGNELRPLFKKWINLSNQTELIEGSGLGTLFEKVSTKLFGHWNNAGKVMGLSAYGIPSETDDLFTFREKLSLLNFEPGISKTSFDLLSPDKFSEAADLAASTQKYFESTMMRILNDLKKEFPTEENLVLVGGCALNCLLNDRILRDKLFQNVFVPAFPNDEGIGLGAAAALAKNKGAWTWAPTPFKDLTAAMGPLKNDTANKQIEVPSKFEDYQVLKPPFLEVEVAKLLVQGEVVAWIQGRSEVGPRALGNRSILVRPDRAGVKEYLNEAIKFREKFRPYGATILHEEAHHFFDIPHGYQSPFMTFSPRVRESKADLIPGVIHQDGTCRIQTLMREQNPRFHTLLSEFHRQSKIPVLLNTSLNIMGQPIVETIEDALLFFQQSNIEILVYGDYLITKRTINIESVTEG